MHNADGGDGELMCYNSDLHANISWAGSCWFSSYKWSSGGCNSAVIGHSLSWPLTHGKLSETARLDAQFREF